MKKLIKLSQSKLLVGLLILFLYSCQEKAWDDYYIKPDYLKEGSIMDVLNEKPEYKEFRGLVRKTGLDSLLRRNEMLTVFALKNGSFSGIDTTIDLVGLKKIIGMHILNSALFKDNMENTHFLSTAGKLLKFTSSPDGQKINKITILSLVKRVINGVVYEVENVIKPLPSINEFVYSAPEFTFFKSYIDSNYTNIIDVNRNITISFDTLGKPVYKQPIIYIKTSDYMKMVKTDDETILSTAFLPNLSALDNLYKKMLVARGGDMRMIIPQLGINHGDTIIGGNFIPANTTYIGDSAMLREYLFSNNIIHGEITDFTNGINSFTNLVGNQFVIDKTQILTNATKYASNGYIYTLNDITLPDIAYLRPYILQTLPTVSNGAIPSVQIPNPNIVYKNGASTTPTVTNVSSAYAGKYTTFRFNQIGGAMDITFPYVIKGSYDLSAYLTGTTAILGYFDVYYNSVKLKTFCANAAQTVTDKYTFSINKIKVAASGPVVITFVLADRGRDLGGNSTDIFMSALALTPVSN